MVIFNGSVATLLLNSLPENIAFAVSFATVKAITQTDSELVFFLKVTWHCKPSSLLLLASTLNVKKDVIFTVSKY